MMFTLEEAKKAVGGRFVSNTDSIVFATAIEVCGVSTDTRTIRPGELFIALRGDNYDGNGFLEEAVQLGACAVMTDDAKKIPEGAVAIVVEDTARALCLLASHYRFKLGCKVIAVTGSIGKTWARTMIAEVLSTALKVHSNTEDSNEIGMSKTILSAPEDCDVIVVEMGMKGKGLISYLSEIARPDIAIITSGGYSHIGILGSKDAIMNARMEICDGLTDGGIIAVNADDRMLFDHCVKVLPINNFIAGIKTGEGDDLPCPIIISATDITEDENGTSFKAVLKRMDKRSEFSVPLRVGMFGDNAVRNALFAVFCAYMTGITKEHDNQKKIAEAILNRSAIDGKGATFETSRYLVMNDAYNASPESMEDAFLNFSKKAAGRRKILALGGMLELGKFASGLHELTGRSCAGYDFDRVFITGDNTDEFIRGAHMVDMELEIVKCKDTEDVRRRLDEYVRDGDALLFKASHSFGFETVAKYFIEKGNA